MSVCVCEREGGSACDTHTHMHTMTRTRTISMHAACCQFLCFDGCKVLVFPSMPRLLAKRIQVIAKVRKSDLRPKHTHTHTSNSSQKTNWPVRNASCLLTAAGLRL